MKRNKPIALLILTVFALFFAACNGITQSVKETFRSAPTTIVDGENAGGENAADVPDFLTAASELDIAEQRFRGLPQFTGKNIRLYKSVHFYSDGRISLQVQHPENPAHVDEYKYRDGKWAAPSPVQLSVKVDINENLVPLDELPFSTAAEVTKNYNSKAAGVDGADPSTHTYAILRAAAITWHPRTISGSREKYSIDFNPDGTIESFERK